MTSSFHRDEVKNRVRETADIVQVIGEYVELKKAGSRYTGLCPFHAEKTPSFSVNPQGQFFHCFGCGESGDVFTFLMKYSNLSFPEALKDLARRYQIDLPEPKLSEADRKRVREREAIFGVNEEAAAIYHACLMDGSEGKAAREYLVQRGVDEEAARAFRLGYVAGPEQAGWSFVINRLQARNFQLTDIEKAGLAVRKERGGYYDRFRDRILFPILDMTGRVAAFGGRILGEGKPKYMNSPESPVFEKSRLLFGLYQHRESIRSRRQAIVVEGNFDLLLLAAHGITNVVAPLGTALSASHIRALRGYCDEAVLLFDGDSAGLKAAMRSIPFFLAEQVDARVAVLPEGHDPDTYVREKGREGIARLVEEASPLAEFVFDFLARQYGTTLQGKSRILAELQQIAGAGTDRVQKALMTAHFSEKLGLSATQFEAGMPDVSVAGKTSSAPPPQRLRDLPRKQRQLVDFLIYYPEFLDELLNHSVEEVVTSQPVREIIFCLKELAKDGTPSPDRLLSALSEDSGERTYVAEMLIAGGTIETDGSEDKGRQMCDELLHWIAGQKQQQESAGLMQRINAAQRSGDTELLMELLRQKQEMGKKC